MDKSANALLHGTLDVLVLKTLASGPRHGYAIARWLEEAAGEALAIEDGSLYPALYRMEKRGWIEAEWGASELGRRVKTYRLTATGRARLKRETETWEQFSRTVSRILLAVPAR
jgi:PadR family transcriptional regulator, regulatory protein PadR